jgi:L-lactate dehydrogenase complex protein LldF
MVSPFRKKIIGALEDKNLQDALDLNAERRLSAIGAAYATLPDDLQTMRKQARQIRERVIEHLEEYLDQFIKNAQANRINIHRAESANQAIEIILDIVRRKNARLVAKSKSMVSEEIHINPALEAAGINVVETDLGEFIIQLNKQAPSHIITPAVHLTRQEVGEIFARELNIPFTEDISELTAVAREELRRTFLDADVGISGVNFGVVEDGALCVLTNEGNGRMVTTLPETHIAVMGIERMVPTVADLATMLYLLPRSATGQKLTVYTTLIRGPRQEGESDGPRECHLILVDNGRSELRNSALRESLYCIRCGACLNACPVFREIGGHAYVGVEGQATTYPGPIGSVVSPGLFGAKQYSQLARASSLCGACRDACPVDIDLPKLLLRVRAGSGASGHTIQGENSAGSMPKNVPLGIRLGMHIFSWMATSPSRFGIGQWFAKTSGKIVSPSGGWIKLPSFTGWGYSRDLPRPASPFREQYRKRKEISIPKAAQYPSSEREKSADPMTGNTPHEQRPAYHRASSSNLQKFEQELTALDGSVIYCETKDVGKNILAVLEEEKTSWIQAWDSQEFPDGLLDELQDSGIRIQTEPHQDIKVGLTAASAGIAETGTLAISRKPGCPQTASLLPEVHIAVLYKGDIYENLPEVLKLKELQNASYLTLISGPSRTADIQMTLTIGVHGPGKVIVICFG